MQRLSGVNPNPTQDFFRGIVATKSTFALSHCRTLPQRRHPKSPSLKLKRTSQKANSKALKLFQLRAYDSRIAVIQMTDDVHTQWHTRVQKRFKLEISGSIE